MVYLNYCAWKGISITTIDVVSIAAVTELMNPAMKEAYHLAGCKVEGSVNFCQVGPVAL